MFFIPVLLWLLFSSVLEVNIPIFLLCCLNTIGARCTGQVVEAAVLSPTWAQIKLQAVSVSPTHLALCSIIFLSCLQKSSNAVIAHGRQWAGGALCPFCLARCWLALLPWHLGVWQTGCSVLKNTFLWCKQVLMWEGRLPQTLSNWKSKHCPFLQKAFVLRCSLSLWYSSPKSLLPGSWQQ